MGRIYLDFNAASPLDPKVEEAYFLALRSAWANPGSTHREGQASRALLAEARERIARAFGVYPQQVVFFSCATEAVNTFINAFSGHAGSHILTSSVEHAAVWESCRFLVRQRREVTFLKVGERGAPVENDVKDALRDGTQAIALMSVNNETGVMTDIEAIARLAGIYKIPLIVDGVAHLGKAPFTFTDGMTAACFSGYKVHGPAGVGFAIVQNGLLFTPLLHGGGQESGRRSGSENVAAIYATSVAVELAIRELKENMDSMRFCRDLFERRILEVLPEVHVNGMGERVCNTSNLAFTGVRGEELLIQLDLAGVAASHGAACSAGSLEPSRVLLEMGYPRERVQSSVRFSVSKLTTKQEAEEGAKQVIDAVHRLRHL